jgi:hypothetical protein
VVALTAMRALSLFLALVAAAGLVTACASRDASRFPDTAETD